MSSNLPLVSIITPSFNQADYLEETICSVLEQDYPHIEYLVVDGGSTDGSGEIVRRYADRIDWWVSEPDKGQADALNKGFARAKGQIVAWLNSDDIYRPGAIRQVVDALIHNPEASLVYANLDSIDDLGRVFNTIRYRQYALLDLLSFRIIGQPTVFMRREILHRAGPLDISYNYLLDHQLWIRMAQIAPIKYIPEIWAAARHHPEAKNAAHASRFGEEALRIVDWEQSQPGLNELVRKHRRRVFGGAHRLAARYFLDGGEPRKALKEYGLALSSDPGFAIQHWKRMLAAIAGILGLEWLFAHRNFQVANSRPILVTGAHRSGTTWVGRMLGLSGTVAYVSEPLNVWHRTGVFDARVTHWYTYICEENELHFLAPMRQTIKLNYHLWKEIRSLRSVKDMARMARDSSAFAFGRLAHRRALLKDPFAIFSASWFARRLNSEVVIVLRHPAAFVSSLKRLGWSFDFGDLLAQPLLMRDWLKPFRKEMEEFISHPEDVIGQASLLWRIICHVTRVTQEHLPKIIVVRHEDLSNDPVTEFEKLYARLGLPYTDRVKAGVLGATSPDNPQEAPEDAVHATRLDSKANLEIWKRRLTKEEIARIRSLTADVAGVYYSDADWD